jgi:hypothetical protein
VAKKPDLDEWKPGDLLKLTHKCALPVWPRGVRGTGQPEHTALLEKGEPALLVKWVEDENCGIYCHRPEVFVPRVGMYAYAMSSYWRRVQS